MVYRIYVERKPGFAAEAEALLKDLCAGGFALTGVRVLSRYDVEHIAPALLEECLHTVFSEPQTDDCFLELPADCGAGACKTFAVEYLPGQFDQRADSAEQCVQLIGRGERPSVRTARVYLLYGMLSEEELAAVKRQLINPVESREASLTPVGTLALAAKTPEETPVLAFRGEDAEALIRQYGLAMDAADVRFCQQYFMDEGRDPTLAELRVIDTYWSDHCRHTTFLTELTPSFAHARAEKAYGRYLALRRELGDTKPVTLMDMATIGAKALKRRGILQNVVESEEINACTVAVTADVAGKDKDWLLLFKNETHNHPTEIEPFGGAATCIGGAIRDPLSGRAYVYQAMRVTGAADPLAPLSETLPGKLPQRKLVTGAAAGYSSYGNQIGLATGMVSELYHPGYAAKHMELGAVVGAVPAGNVRRERPAPGDCVVLLGGRTGRDGCGGATGSSKAHSTQSLETCGAEVQKGNAPEERKLQRLFRNPQASRLIKRCNDFGAGGVAVAVGELAAGLVIDLDAVPKKYEGLTATELAISESQERMAVVLAPEDTETFLRLAGEENMEATVIAHVAEAPRLVMRACGRTVVDLSRAFLDSNGAPKSTQAHAQAPRPEEVRPWMKGEGKKRLLALVSDLSVCSQRGLAERFDSTISAGTVLMPFGGRRQRTPTQAMAAKLPVPGGETATCSLMAYGFEPYRSAADPYHGAYLSVAESVCKLVAAGGDPRNSYLTLQEYFPRPGSDPNRWGLPLAAMLGALDAQLDLGVAAIGGKDSMSGTFEHLDVPPTLVSFAVGTAHTQEILSPEFKRAGSVVSLLAPRLDGDGLPDPQSLKETLLLLHALIREGHALSVWVLGAGGIAEAAFKMGLGNALGMAFDRDVTWDSLFLPHACAFVLELAPGTDAGQRLGTTQVSYAWNIAGETVDLSPFEEAYESKLEPVYPSRPPYEAAPLPQEPAARPVAPLPHVGCAVARPRVLIPVFPGTNCEYDTAAAFEHAGAIAQTFVVRNLTAAAIEESAEAFTRALRNSQILFLPGGFSAGDEPDGSGKFITAFLRTPHIREEIGRMLAVRDGLIGGICNGFQALIKLGLVPFGEIRDMDAACPTLTYNAIGRHQSRIVRTRICSSASPWLMYTHTGEVYCAPVSHGEGRLACPGPLLDALFANGQVATQYVDEAGRPSMGIDSNPNGSVAAIEGLLSPDGRVLGKMAHSERVGAYLYKNVPGNYDLPLFRGGVDYFRK